MSGKSFALSITLLSLPIGIITYLYAFQPDDCQSYMTDTGQHELSTNLAVAEASIVSDTPEQPNATSSARNITVHNKINKKMITYHKGFFSLEPNFNLSVNDRTVKPGQQLEIPIVDNKINVTYAYDFMGHKKGKKTITFEVPTNKDALDVTFSWKEEPRVNLGNAKALEVKEIY